MQTRIHNFLAETFAIDFSQEVNDQTNLKLAKVIDSFSYIEIVLFLRTELGVDVTPDDLAEGRLDSVEAITALVAAQSAAEILSV